MSQNRRFFPSVSQLFFKEHLEMSVEEIGKVGIVKVYRQGDPKAKRRFPRPVFEQFQDLYQRKKS
jgi:hypothetical protein